MKKILMIFTAVFTMSSVSQASINVEPFLGYTFSGEVGTSDLTGVGYGARVGYDLALGLGFGAEYFQGSYTAENTAGVESDFEPTDIGVYVSYDFPILVRAWATYVISGKEDSGAAELSGNGFKVGVGFTGLPFVAINLEYTTINYDESETAGVTTAIDRDRDGIMLNVSLPLSIPFL